MPHYPKAQMAWRAIEPPSRRAGAWLRSFLCKIGRASPMPSPSWPKSSRPLAASEGDFF